MAAQAARGELTCGQQVSYQNSINSMAEQWQPEIDYSSVLCDQTTALSSVSSADPNYGYPSQAEQQALSVLKNYPDSVLANWFELSRNGPDANIPAGFVCLANINVRLVERFRHISITVAAI